MSEESLKAGASLRLRVPNRSQMEFRVECPEALVSEDDPVRVIWEATGRLDLSGFYEPIKAREGHVGRDATDPRLLVSLWLYATSQGVGSARELARLCESHRGYQWLCGGVSVNHHLLSDFRVLHGKALDELLTQILAVLCQRGLIEVWRISQDGLRVRACSGASSFRRRDRLQRLLEQARRHVEELRSQLEDPSQAGKASARQQAARERAARERTERLEKALARLPELETRQRQRALKVSRKDQPKKLKEPRASTTDAEARVMKMSDGGYRPAYNVQLACDPQSRAVVGVEVTNEGVDTHQSEPMRQQVERRTGSRVGEQLMDGGYLDFEQLDRAAEQGVSLYVPAKPPRNPSHRASAYDPRYGDSPAIAQWRQRMGSSAGQEIYRQRAATIETINADLRCRRGLQSFNVRGLDKVRCVALWAALAYNLMHFGKALIQSA
jgi:transposase